MQQKTLKYILIGGVVFIWGLIIYKIIDATGEEVVPVKPSVNYNVKDMEFEKFTLNADYPDPFLPDATTVFDSVKTPGIPQPPVQQSETPKPDLSFIEYHGMINNPLKRVKVGMIKLNGKELLVKEKEEIGEVSITKIGKDVLSIFFRGQSYRIRKE